MQIFSFQWQTYRFEIILTSYLAGFSQAGVNISRKISFLQCRMFAIGSLSPALGKTCNTKETHVKSIFGIGLNQTQNQMLSLHQSVIFDREATYNSQGGAAKFLAE